MKNNDPAALELFSNYSAFMLTDDELLIIHGGTTNTTGGTNSGGGTSPGGGIPGGPMGPPLPPTFPTPAGPAPPAAPSIPSIQIEPVNVNVKVEDNATHLTDTLGDSQREIVHEAVNLVDQAAHSDTVHAVDNFFSTAINAATHYFFGTSTGH